MEQGRHWILIKFWKNSCTNSKAGYREKTRLGQGRAGMRRKVKLAPPSQGNGVSTGPGSSESKPNIINDEAVSVVDPILPKPLSEIPRSEVLPPYILLQNRPPPKPPDQLINKQDIGNTKIKLKDLIDTRNIIQ